MTEKSSQEKIVCMQGKIYVIANSESSYKCIDGHGFFVSTNDGLKLLFPIKGLERYPYLKNNDSNSKL